jgi:hypothetical protein
MKRAPIEPPARLPQDVCSIHDAHEVPVLVTRFTKIVKQAQHEPARTEPGSVRDMAHMSAHGEQLPAARGKMQSVFNATGRLCHSTNSLGAQCSTTPAPERETVESSGLIAASTDRAIPISVPI